jgi:hypothetical protein
MPLETKASTRPRKRDNSTRHASTHADLPARAAGRHRGRREPLMRTGGAHAAHKRPEKEERRTGVNRCGVSLWASEELNLGPHAYQACALTT